MVNRERFLLDDLDSEGFPIPKPRDPLPLLALNIGRLADHGMVQALLADHKCVQCAPSITLVTDLGEVDVTDAACNLNYTDPRLMLGGQREKGDVLRAHWIDETREVVREADAHMDGITRLSDSYAPDAYYGWKR